MANLVTLARVLLLFIGIAFLYAKTVSGGLTAFVIILSVILLDWLDGYIARRRGSPPPVGAVIDIVGDRIVENSLWIVFAHLHLIPVWAPLVVVIRGFLTDAVRSLALKEGKTPFGDLHQSSLGRVLVSSRGSRALYAVAKAVTFCSLSLYEAYLSALQQVPPESALPGWRGAAEDVALGMTSFTVLFCLVRGLPVLYDGWAYLKRPAER